jgi:intracellular sulfur oxidation DsrE/DsrF family protein
MKKQTLVLFAALLLIVPGAIAKSRPRHKVIIQLSNADTTVWKATIQNLKNLKNGWGDDVQIEVVAHGPGIGFLMREKTTQADAIHALKSLGVAFVGCENTLRERKIDRSQLLPEAGTVPMGVGEVILRQEEGWSYLKAGF